MVNEKKIGARPGMLGVLVWTFFMHVAKSPGLLACCLFPPLYLLVSRLTIMSPFEQSDAPQLLLILGMLFSTCMVPGTTTVYPMAEAREKHTLRTLTLAGVDRNQMIVARGIVSTLYTALVVMACFLVSGISLENMLPFALITVLASIPLTVFSLALGLVSRNQMAASFSSLPIVIVGMAPMFFMHDASTFAALPLLPSGGGLSLVYALVQGQLLSPESILPILAQLAWIVVSIVAFIIVAPRIARDE